MLTGQARSWSTLLGSRLLFDGFADGPQLGLRAPSGSSPRTVSPRRGVGRQRRVLRRHPFSDRTARWDFSARRGGRPSSRRCGPPGQTRARETPSTAADGGQSCFPAAPAEWKCRLPPRALADPSARPAWAERPRTPKPVRSRPLVARVRASTPGPACGYHLRTYRASSHAAARNGGTTCPDKPRRYRWRKSPASVRPTAVLSTAPSAGPRRGPSA